MGNCSKCGEPSKNYVLCLNCLKKLKENAWEETKNEFIRQWELDNIKDQSEIFRHACYEVEHNSYYEKLTEDEYMERVFDEFSAFYFDKLIGCKLYTIKTGEKKMPNDTNYGLYYWHDDDEEE